jgi:hypothetical protein
MKTDTYVLALAFETLSDLGEARQAWIGTIMSLTIAKRELVLEQAISEQSATTLAGGPKGLGSNAELRKQALIIALEKDPDYQLTLRLYDEAFEREARAKQEVLTLNDALDLFKVVLG